jgi:hypothetical protein
MNMPAETFAAATLAEVVADRRPTLASDHPPSQRAYEATAGELRALIYQVAEMAEREPDQLVVVAEYLHGLLDREPLRSNPVWEPQRVVLGLFLMGLTNALAELEVITTEERAALRPAYQLAAGAEVREFFDQTYIPDPSPEETDTVPTAPALDDLTDDDAAKYL